MLGGDAEALLDVYSLEDVPIGRLNLTPSLIERVLMFTKKWSE